MGFDKSCSKREVHSNTIIPQEIGKALNRQSIHLKFLKRYEQKRKKNTKVSRRKQIIKIRAERNEKEMKEIITKINKAKHCFFEKINKTEKPLADSSRKKGRKIKSIILEMRQERLNRQHRNTKDHKII